MADNIETLDTIGRASDAARGAWAAVRNEWSSDRTEVHVWVGLQFDRPVSVPTARLDDFLAELVRNPAVTRIDIRR